MYIGSEGNGGIHVERQGTRDCTCRSINTIFIHVHVCMCISDNTVCNGIDLVKPLCTYTFLRHIRVKSQCNRPYMFIYTCTLYIG